MTPFDILSELFSDPMARLKRQLVFLTEAERMKSILRQTPLFDNSRMENDAEHSWELMLMAVTLAEYAAVPLDMLRVMKLLLVHDLVEVYAGDTPVLDTAACADQAEREEVAAEKLFGLLPDDQGSGIHELWREFTARESDEAQFAYAIDRLQPLLHNVMTGGKSWWTYDQTNVAVLSRQKGIERIAPDLWRLVEQMVEWSVAQGYLRQG